ncbi:MAG: threonine aldolase family protein [Paracoccaceae bacterium]|nr:threonine aldolase family protein [Paracoccaceae bacterium]MDG1369552.1 threonine aldolase family protein [Paracoccaceae bacterium]MDG1972154.1 threonine aldolase family protein [Paracoccaceae bacterium]
MHDFYSDTKTKPTEAMRRVVLDCEVGDEQKGEDPTTNELSRRVADLLGKEAGLFLPSGSMCNEIAIRAHTSPGDEIMCDQSCHIINFETGAPAALSSVMIKSLAGQNGIFTPEQVAEAIRPASRYAPKSALLCAEQTANMGGGAVWPSAQVNAVAATAKDAGLATHMDGARLMNAVVKSGVGADEFSANFDSVWIDFTKGLGAPVGAVLAGSDEFIQRAWRLKQQFGGAMRQSGIVASMCLHALDHHVDRLADDHALASALGAEIAALDLVDSVMPVETNIVIFDLSDAAPTAAEVVSQLYDDGVIAGAFGPKRIRVVTHLDVTPASGEALIAGLKKSLMRG